MADLIVVYWRDIPAQVIAKAGRRNQVKIELDQRFAKAIDIAAMKGGARDDDAYLADWRKAAPVGVGRSGRRGRDHGPAVGRRIRRIAPEGADGEWRMGGVVPVIPAAREASLPATA